MVLVGPTTAQQEVVAARFSYPVGSLLWLGSSGMKIRLSLGFVEGRDVTRLRDKS
jgi:hypothetical protein